MARPLRAVALTMFGSVGTMGVPGATFRPVGAGIGTPGVAGRLDGSRHPVLGRSMSSVGMLDPDVAG